MTELEQKLVDAVRRLNDGLTSRLNAQNERIESLSRLFSKENERFAELERKVESLLQLLK